MPRRNHRVGRAGASRLKPQIAKAVQDAPSRNTEGIGEVAVDGDSWAPAASASSTIASDKSAARSLHDIGVEFLQSMSRVIPSKAGVT
jgi:hypothetical protein